MKRLFAIALIIACLLVPHFAMSDTIASGYSSVEIIQYDKSQFMLVERGAGKAALSMYNLEGQSAVKAWSNEYEGDFKAYPLPGIGKIALLYKDAIRVIAYGGDMVDELSFDEKKSGWHYPIFSSRMSAMAFNDANYNYALVITDKKITIVDVASKAKERIVTLFAFVDGKGTIYFQSEKGNKYWKAGIDGSCKSVKFKGQLAYVDDGGVWIFRNRKLRPPKGNSISLPKIQGKYTVGQSHHGGVIFDEKFAVSAIDGRMKKWTLSSEESYGFSRNLRYFLGEGDWDDQQKGLWQAWSLDRGMFNIQREHQSTPAGLTVVDPGYIVFDNGTALIIGESDSADSWRLWALNINSGEYTPIELMEDE